MTRAALLLAALAAAAQEPEPAGVALPPGPVAEALAPALAAVPAGALPAPWPTWPADPAWETAEPWARWVALVRAEAAAEAPDPARRTALALLAAEQRRSADAWRHLAEAAADPELAAAALPRLFPGALPPAPGAPLPAGALLRPVLPPPTPGLPKGAPDLREVAVHGLAVGDARLGLRLSVESDGVEARLAHEAGGPARLVLDVPLPLEMQPASVHVDWVRREEPLAPLELALAPGDEELAVWIRWEPVAHPWPEGLPAELGAVPRRGLVLEVDAGDPRAARLARAAEALGRLLDVPARLRRRTDPDAVAPGPRELVIGLPADVPAAVAEQELAALLSLAERFALREAREAGEAAPR